MEIENIKRIDGWLLLNPNLKENEWQYEFCTCGINAHRTLSEAHETYNEYIKSFEK